MATSVPASRVMYVTSRSRRIGITGFCTAPSRGSAASSTIASIVVGSCQLTTDPALTPSAAKPAATAAAVSTVLREGE